MKSFLCGVLIVLCAYPLDAYAGCRKRFRVKQVVVKQVVQQVYLQPVQAVVYPQAAPVAVAAAQIQPVYVQQQQAVAAVCCCVPCVTPAAVPPATPVAPHPQPAPPLSPPPAGSDVPQADASDAEIQAVATRACIECHGDVNPKKGLKLTDVSLLTREQRLSCAAKIMLGTMPPGKPEALTDAEAQAWLKWSERKTPAVP